MIEIDRKDRQRIVRAIEYMVEHGDNKTVDDMLKQCSITF